MSDTTDCVCGHSALSHDARFGTCYETGEDRCTCYRYAAAQRAKETEE